MNYIPAGGSIQITWPSQVTITKDVTCTVTTNRSWENSCIIDEANNTINILNVFSEQQAFISEIKVILVGVVNPQNNKEKGSGF